MSVLTNMRATFADRFAETPTTRPARVADVAACGCAEPVEPTCTRRLCRTCCPYDCNDAHAARDHGADE